MATGHQRWIVLLVALVFVGNVLLSPMYQNLITKVTRLRNVTTGNGTNNMGDETPLQREHPTCFSKDLFTRGTDNTKTLQILKVGKYAKIGKNVTRPTRYTHLCSNIKPRYNCAKKNASDLEYGELATDWKLNLLPNQTQTSNVCNLWEFTEALGGPVGLADSIMETKNSPSKKNDKCHDKW